MPTKDPLVRSRNSRAYYERNRERIKQKAAEYNRQKREEGAAYIAEYLLAHPCVDCGETDPLVLDFDHRERDMKEFGIGANRGQADLQRLVEEINKCDVRCANCHRRRTAEQFNTWRWQLFGGMTTTDG